MRSSPRSHILLAAALSVAAGYIDAVGYLNSGGFFLSFMSGNSTRLGVGLGGVAWSAAEISGSIITTFVAGVMTGTLISSRTGPRRILLILPMVTCLLSVASLSQFHGALIPCFGLSVFAMGLMNTIFQRGGEVSIGLTYMTGALVKIGQNLATALQGGPLFGWLPYLTLWASLVSGAAIGAWADHALGIHAIQFAAAYLGVITLAVFAAWKKGFRLAS